MTNNLPFDDVNEAEFKPESVSCTLWTGVGMVVVCVLIAALFISIGTK